MCVNETRCSGDLCSFSDQSHPVGWDRGNPSSDLALRAPQALGAGKGFHGQAGSSGTECAGCAEGIPG